jgi:hypothetical protein
MKPHPITLLVLLHSCHSHPAEAPQRQPVRYWVAEVRFCH